MMTEKDKQIRKAAKAFDRILKKYDIALAKQKRLAAKILDIEREFTEINDELAYLVNGIPKPDRSPASTITPETNDELDAYIDKHYVDLGSEKTK